MSTLPTLNSEQQAAFDIADAPNSGNMLICGPPGVGKSVVINSLTELGKKPYTVGAPTGLAALNIHGKTLHSIFGLPASSGIMGPDYNKFTTNDSVLKYVKYRVRNLIIDEISMVRSDMFDFLDRFLREVKEVNKPFGGIQVILVGDFFQLPPIVTWFEQKKLNSLYHSEFAFDADVFREGNFKIIQLKEIVRQSDAEFIRLLQSARIGKVHNRDISTLNKLVGYKNDGRIRLCGGNKQADSANQQYLNGLDGTAQVSSADCYGDCRELLKQVPENLFLKIGARVMVKKNQADKPPGAKADFISKVVNGSMGKVIEIETDRVRLVLDSGNDEVWVYRQSLEQKIKEQKDGEWGERIVASMVQVPLQLAWAISMHKSQGQTFDKVHIDASQVFAAGQLYVALSRCKTMEGLSFEDRLHTSKFLVNKDVVNFYKKLDSVLDQSGPVVPLPKRKKNHV